MEHSNLGGKIRTSSLNSFPQSTRESHGAEMLTLAGTTFPAWL